MTDLVAAICVMESCVIVVRAVAIKPVVEAPLSIEMIHTSIVAIS